MLERESVECLRRGLGETLVVHGIVARIHRLRTVITQRGSCGRRAGPKRHGFHDVTEIARLREDLERRRRGSVGTDLGEDPHLRHASDHLRVRQEVGDPGCRRRPG